MFCRQLQANENCMTLAFDPLVLPVWEVLESFLLNVLRTTLFYHIKAVDLTKPENLKYSLLDY